MNHLRPFVQVTSAPDPSKSITIGRKSQALAAPVYATDDFAVALSVACAPSEMMRMLAGSPGSLLRPLLSIAPFDKHLFLDPLPLSA